jgi:hypothetical protein
MPACLGRGNVNCTTLLNQEHSPSYGTEEVRLAKMEISANVILVVGVH